MSATTSSGSSEDDTRCILLVDMDCFYVQVEQQLRPGHSGRPAAVVQYRAWRGGGIIAINYEARAFGVRRGHHGDDARRLCPHIELYRVPERGGKADLSRYRAAGARVLSVLGRFSDIVQRASIDEAFVQLKISDEQLCKLPSATQLANTLVVGYEETEQQQQEQEEEREPSSGQLECTGGESGSADQEVIDVLERQKEENRKRRHRAALSVERFLAGETTTESDLTHGDRLLAAGAAICEQIRQAVFDETGYRCSAGVAHNKLMAKVCASLNKPNGQVLLLADQVRRLLAPMPVHKLRFLGGKLGASVEQHLGCTTLGQLMAVPQSLILQHFDAKTAKWLQQLACGRDSDPVNPQLLPKSIGCGRNFRGPETLRTTQRVRQWVQQLSEEISERLHTDTQLNARTATSLTVSASDDNGRQMSRSAPLRRHTHQHIADAAYQLLSKLRTFTNGGASTGDKQPAGDSPWNPPLTNISLCASRFVETSNVRIEDMLSRVTSSTCDSPGPTPVCGSSTGSPSVSNSETKPVISVAPFANISAISDERSMLCTSVDPETSNSSDIGTDSIHTKTSADVTSNQTGFFARRMAQLRQQQKSAQEHNQPETVSESRDEVEDSGVSVESISTETTECSRCGHQVSPWSLPEHLDWHMAVDLSAQLSAEASTAPAATISTSASSGSSRRGRAKRTSRSRGTGAARKVQRRGSSGTLSTIDRYFRS